MAGHPLIRLIALPGFKSTSVPALSIPNMFFYPKYLQALRFAKRLAYVEVPCVAAGLMHPFFWQKKAHYQTCTK